jgi:hypothetical protein
MPVFSSNGEGTASNMVIFELFVEPGVGAPNHHQPDEDEFWYVLEGQLEIQVGDVERTVGPWGFGLCVAGQYPRLQEYRRDYGKNADDEHICGQRSFLRGYFGVVVRRRGFSPSGTHGRSRCDLP